jgi:uncharacterized membrane protein
MNASTGKSRRREHGNDTRLSLLWAGIRDSLWFVPTLCTLGAVLLATVIVRLDAQWNLEGALGGVLFSGGAEGARGVLTAVAGSLITVTGVVFSVTIVALQLASSQFTPRVLRGFMADRANQVVLGIFIGTFTYAVMVLRTVTAADETGPAFVPEVAVTMAIVFVLVSIGALIYFIDHAARSIQAAVILSREAEHTLHRIDRIFPRHVGEPEAPPQVQAPTAAAGFVLADKSGYLLAVHADGLFELAEEKRMTIRMEPPIGGFVLPGEALATVWPKSAVDEALIQVVRESFLLGEERTPEQDAELGITVIGDMAVRALSPGINDPTTAMLCIDRLTEILVRLGAAPEPAAARTGQDGSVRLLARLTSFERAVSLAFDQIRHFGVGNPAIAKKLMDAMRRIGALVPAHQRLPLIEQVERVRWQARNADFAEGDLGAIERLAADSLALLRGEPPPIADEARTTTPRPTLTHR